MKYIQQEKKLYLDSYEKIQLVSKAITFSTNNPERLPLRNVEEVVERQLNILREKFDELAGIWNFYHRLGT